MKNAVILSCLILLVVGGWFWWRNTQESSAPLQEREGEQQEGDKRQNSYSSQSSSSIFLPPPPSPPTWAGSVSSRSGGVAEDEKNGGKPIVPVHPVNRASGDQRRYVDNVTAILGDIMWLKEAVPIRLIAVTGGSVEPFMGEDTPPPDPSDIFDTIVKRARALDVPPQCAGASHRLQETIDGLAGMMETLSESPTAEELQAVIEKLPLLDPAINALSGALNSYCGA